MFYTAIARIETQGDVEIDERGRPKRIPGRTYRLNVGRFLCTDAADVFAMAMRRAFTLRDNVSDDVRGVTIIDAFSNMRVHRPARPVDEKLVSSIMKQGHSRKRALQIADASKRRRGAP